MMTYNSLVWDNFPEIQSKVNVAKNERKKLENKTGKNVITGENFLKPKK